MPRREGARRLRSSIPRPDRDPKRAETRGGEQARTVEVDGGLMARARLLWALGATVAARLLEALAADGGRHAAGQVMQRRKTSSFCFKVGPSLVVCASVWGGRQRDPFAFHLSTTPGSCQSQDRPRHHFPTPPFLTTGSHCSPYDFFSFSFRLAFRKWVFFFLMIKRTRSKTATRSLYLR